VKKRVERRRAAEDPYGSSAWGKENVGVTRAGIPTAAEWPLRAYPFFLPAKYIR